jgi:hypothetical protein
MPNPTPSPDPTKKSRSLREFMEENNGRQPGVARSQPPAKEDPWGDNAEKQTGLDSASDQEHEEIMRRLRSQGGAVQPAAAAPREERKPAARPAPAAAARPAPAPASSPETEELKAENQELRTLVAELEESLAAASQAGGGGGAKDSSWEDREREYEALLEEKSEKIRELFVKIQELEKQGGAGGSGKEGGAAPARETPADNEELLALSDELERERCQIEQERRTLDEDRRQLREDEESMMRQMREMELQMAKERAELARQRNELQRLHGEIRHELELAQRDAAVNERLKLLQRRHREVSGEPADEPAPTRKSNQGAGKGDQPKKDAGGSTGIMKRFFGGGEKK